MKVRSIAACALIAAAAALVLAACNNPIASLSGGSQVSANAGKLVSRSVASLNTSFANLSHSELFFANEASRAALANSACTSTGSGGFNCSNIDSQQHYSARVAVGDFNGDGYPDAVFANILSANRICLSDGAAGFTCNTIQAGGSYGVAVGDVNNDGKLDAVFATANGQYPKACLGNGAGGFTECKGFGTYTYELQKSHRAVALGDINKDGNLDVVFANGRLCLGDGQGGFACQDLSSSLPITGRTGVAIGDVNNDGNPDVVFSAPTGDIVCLGNGDGTFGSCSVIPGTPGHYSSGVALGDVNGDGNLDAVISEGYSSNNSNLLCTGNGDGTFTCSSIATPHSGITGVALGDLNGDGNLDIVFSSSSIYGNPDTTNLIGYGDGKGGFTFQEVSPDAIDSSAVAVATPADSDGDGVPNNLDACPHSDLSSTVVIGGNDSGVSNTLFSNGCTLADDINAAAATAKNHGGFVSAVAALTNGWVSQGVITGRAKGAIQSSAAKAKNL